MTMDQQQHQNQVQQASLAERNDAASERAGGGALAGSSGNGTTSSATPPPTAPVIPTFGGGVGMNAQILGQLMTNPSLAAAAAASPLFPPAAMLTNPGAFLTMPEYYSSAGAIQNDQAARDSAAAINSAVSLQATQVTSGQQQNQQQQFLAHLQQQAHSQGSTAAPFFPMVGAQQPVMPYGAALPPPGILSNQMAPSSVQAHMAASAAASQAIAGAMGDPNADQDMDGKGKRKKDLTPAERAKQNRERNREHAKSTRLRKKAYIQKLKELVEGLHAERTEEVRQRRVAIQHLAETQNVRRAVIRSFLRFHANYERDQRKWETILDDDFWLKQPVTPYRCFRRSEIEQECRISRGVDAAIADAASVAAMIEAVGSRSSRWVHIKREDFLAKEEERTGQKRMPRNIMPQNSRFQHAISSLSSSSNSSNNDGSSAEDGKKKKRLHNELSLTSGKDDPNGDTQKRPGEYHDYHAKPLPDPKVMDQDRESASPSAEEDSQEDCNSGDDAKCISTDTSSGDDSAAAIKEGRDKKRRKVDRSDVTKGAVTGTAGAAAALAMNNSLSGNPLPSNIAKKGGISHSVLPVAKPPLPKNGNARLALAPAVQLPPFAGIGKRASTNSVTVGDSASLAGSVSRSVMDGGGTRSANGAALPRSDSAENPTALDVMSAGPAVISGDIETSSSQSSCSKSRIRAYYHVNEDDMILMEDVIMCPFIFRTQDAVRYGALAECIQPGMIRAHFSTTNKLLSVEMIYDAMGFMQQLERASGSELMAQIIPGSLEMALSPGSAECRVITLAEAPFRIVNVNEAWTKLTKHTQMEVEGVELFSLLDPPSTDGKPSNPSNDLEELLEGRCTCSTRFHCDKDGRTFVDFFSSYPLTNANDEITHILHISKELVPVEVTADENPGESSATTEETNEEETTSQTAEE